VFKEIGGFSNMRFGEDVDFSYKVKEGGYQSRLFHESWVYHKRRNTFKTFFKQVFNSGIARIHLTKRHPGSLKLVHLLPSAFTVGTLVLLLTSIIAGALAGWAWALVALSPLMLLALLLFADSSIRKRSIKTGLCSICTSFVQLGGYGSGLITGWWHICILGKANYAAFVKNFYK
jgi:GT2 family glycosyltransferase